MNVRVVDISMRKSECLGFTISGNIENYLRVANVKLNGPASKAGLKNGDSILKINNFQINNRDDIINSLRESSNTLNIRVIRQIDEDEESQASKNKNNKLVVRRKSVQERSLLQKEILQNIGPRVSIDISRAYPGTLNRIKYFENAREGNEGSQRHNMLQSNNHQLSLNRTGKISSSNQDIPNIPRTMSNVKNIRKSSQNSMKNSPNLSNFKESSLSTSSPTRHSMMSPIDKSEIKEKPFLNLSLRKKSRQGDSYSNYSSSNISYFSKSYQNLPLTSDNDCTPKSSFVNSGSMMSLFDEDFNNSHIIDYQIDWKAIHHKVSITTINNVEKEIINYFTNRYTDLKNFPVNSLYRYITFNGVLDVVFNSILSPDNEVDFHEEILKIPKEICDVDYDMKSYDIVNLIKCNVKRINEQLREYEERKNDLNSQKENSIEKFNEFLVRPQDSKKMHQQMERIYKIFHELSNFLISMVIAMSMWKFSKDFSNLYEGVNYQTNILTTSETMLSEFRRSQKNLEKNIINLFRRFKEEGSEEVLQLFDNLFSETLDLSICIPLLKEKLKRDNEMLGHLDKISTRKSQFV